MHMHRYDVLNIELPFQSHRHRSNYPYILLITTTTATIITKRLEVILFISVIVPSGAAGRVEHTHSVLQTDSNKQELIMQTIRIDGLK